MPAVTEAGADVISNSRRPGSALSDESTSCMRLCLMRMSVMEGQSYSLSFQVRIAVKTSTP
jgi:hypothetical protein